jgi:hypothetical protein
MPSSNKVADAAVIVPYLTHRIIHHGQPTPVPPDNAGRVRKVKGKKPRPRPERRAEDEPRFNVGSPKPRLQTATGRGRKPARVGRQGRRDDHEGNSPYLTTMTDCSRRPRHSRLSPTFIPGSHFYICDCLSGRDIARRCGEFTFRDSVVISR